MKLQLYQYHHASELTQRHSTVRYCGMCNIHHPLYYTADAYQQQVNIIYIN